MELLTMNPKIILRIIKGNKGGYVPAYIVKSQGKTLFTKMERVEFVSKEAAKYFGQCTIKEALQIGYLPV
jgi:hypothetical protein